MKQRPKRANKIKIISFRTVLLALAALILGLSVYSFNAKNLTGNQMPMPLGFGMSVVLSGSMEPRLSVDDLIIVKKTDEFRKQDIVVFQHGSSLVIHRIIDIDGDMITTKGDANNVADEPIDKSAIKGVLVFDIPYVGSIIGFLKQPVVAITLLIGTLLLSELSFSSEKDKDADELKEIMKEIEKLK